MMSLQFFNEMLHTHTHTETGQNIFDYKLVLFLILIDFRALASTAQGLQMYIKIGICIKTTLSLIK